MKRPKILRIITHLPVGGVENKLLELLPLLTGDFEVRIVCIRERGALADAFVQNGIPVHLIPISGRYSPLGIGKLVSFIRQYGIDLVQTHMYPSNISGTVAARMAGISNVVSNVHNVDHWANHSQIRQDKWIMRLRKKVVCVSQAVKKNVIQHTGIPDNKCVVIYNGINLSKFIPGKERMEMRREFGWGEKEVVIGMIARITDKKDPKTFLTTAKIVAEKVSEARFIIVGKPEGRKELWNELQHLAVGCGLENKLVFTGLRQDINRLLAGMDISVLTSIREGFSNTILESMAMGLPVVATNVGGNAEAIRHNENGFITAVKDPNNIADFLVKLCVDQSLRLEMGKVSSNRVKLFSIDKMVSEYKKLYYQLLGI
jgi:glycosyltransferase involved in cell wall biosynthesis